jgi:nucleotide-binding universal stress UspA family protein
MKKIKKILIPTDFSDCSLRTLNFASNIAKRTPAVITLLNVIPNPRFVYGLPDHDAAGAAMYAEHVKYVNKLHEQSKRRLGFLRKSAILQYLPVNIKISIDSNVYKSILRQAKIMNASLIIMGTKGSSISRSFLGTNTERVIRLTYIPVLAVHKNSKMSRFQKIVFASDFTWDAVKVYPLLNTIGKLFNSTVHLLRINTKDNFKPTDQIYRDINKFKKKFKGKFVPTFRAAKDVPDGIAKYAKSVNADLIVIGAKRKKGLSRLLGTKTVESIIRNTNIPVLALDIP